jgi:nicotinamidase-related amidase
MIFMSAAESRQNCADCRRNSSQRPTGVKGVEMQFNPQNTALVLVDPQNEVLSERGGAWPFVEKTVRENRTVENIELLLETAKSTGFNVFVSPHYYFPTDGGWKFRDPVAAMMHENHLFARSGQLSLEGFSGSGADWVDRFRPYIEDGTTIVASPHKLYGPETNDLVLQLRKRGIQKVIVFGMLANMCVDAHIRELLEQGFEVAVVKDATAAPSHPVWGDGYQAALINFNYLSDTVLTTADAVAQLERR